MRHIHVLLVYLLSSVLCLSTYAAHPQKVMVGIEVLLNSEHARMLQGKRIGLITNHTAINNAMESTVDLLKRHAPTYGYTIVALFAPEHGIFGSLRDEKRNQDGKDADGIPIYSLHGKTLRPTKEMLKNIDLLIYDIQDIGSRSYSYVSTLFYAMEEAAKHGVRVMVLDRPNPINGVLVDGPMMEEKWRSIAGYINVPYCHGMTVGELARYFNAEYHVGCQLDVIPMQGWKRHMSFPDTGLMWIPTSPHIPEASTVWYYPTTGILGELQIVNIGVWYTLPFKVVGAPWIDADLFAKKLNAQNFPGVRFQPFHYQPFAGKSKNQDCHGVLIVITDYTTYKPVSTQYLILGMLKSLYPEKFHDALASVQNRKDMFCKVNGTEEVYRLLTQEKYVVWNLRKLHQKEREQFMQRRKKYLIPSYAE